MTATFALEQGQLVRVRPRQWVINEVKASTLPPPAMKPNFDGARREGFRTFTSCEGERGHSFQHETVGIELEGSYSTFHKRLVGFLRSQGLENFTIRR